MNTARLLTAALLTAALAACQGEAPLQTVAPKAPQPFRIALQSAGTKSLTMEEFRAAGDAARSFKRALRLAGEDWKEAQQAADRIVSAHRTAPYASLLEQQVRHVLIRKSLLPAASSPERDAALRANADRLVVMRHPDVELFGLLVEAVPGWTPERRADVARQTLAAADVYESDARKVCPNGDCLVQEAGERPELRAALHRSEMREGGARARLEALAGGAQ